MNWICLARDDEFTWSFSRVGAEGLVNSDRPKWIDFTEMEIPDGGRDREFLLAAAVIHIGEREQRRVVERKIKRGTRNITSRIGRPARYLGWARNPEGMASDDRKEKVRMMREFQGQLSEMIADVRRRLEWEVEVPSRWSYVVTPDVLDAAEEVGCEPYFEKLAGQQFFIADLLRIEETLKGMCPEKADQVIRVFRGTKTDEHLSMISMAADEKGALFVTLVDPEGHFLKVAADRFMEMVSSSDQPRRLHVFPKRGERQKMPFAFNSNEEGEIIGKFLPRQMKFDIVCCQGQGQYSNVHDRSWFYVDPEYLLCLWVVLCRLEEDRNRYARLQQRAEARVEFDPFAVGASL